MRSIVWVALAACGCSASPGESIPPDAGAGSSDALPGPIRPHLELDPTQDTFGFPLHPELARPCARVEGAWLTNDSDTPLAVTGFSSPDPAFSMSGTCAPLTRASPCHVTFCFDSAAPGAHFVTGTITTDQGVFETPLAVTVTDAAPNVAFATPILTTGPAYDNGDAAQLAGAIAGSGKLVLWSRWNLDTVDTAEHDAITYTTVDTFLINWFRGAVDDGQHVYGLIGDSSGGAYSALLRFDETGARDAAFEIDLPVIYGGYYRGLQLAPNGRMFALSTTAVVAVTGGTVDTTYGSNGQYAVAEPLRPITAVDSQSRLYIALDDHVIRLTAAGTLDAFSYPGAAGALAVDAQDHLLVGTATGVARLDDRGAPTATIATMSPVTDLAIDALGRIYVTMSGETQRYAADGTLDRALGFGSTLGVRCGAAGPCWLYGVEHHTVPFPQEWDVDEAYVLRLVD